MEGVGGGGSLKLLSVAKRSDNILQTVFEKLKLKNEWALANEWFNFNFSKTLTKNNYERSE